jgi:YbbR domain-containing protein
MKQVLTHNWGLKALSLALAAAGWLAINSGMREMTASVSAIVQYHNLSYEVEVVSAQVESVHLFVRGSSAHLARLANHNIPIILDLASARSAGERTFTITRDLVNLPAGVELERAVPSQIRLRLEERITREIPVKARVAGVPAGFTAEIAAIDPPVLSVTGPRSRVENLSFVETDPIDLSSAPLSGQARVPVFSQDPQVHFSARAETSVQFRLSRLEGKK